MTGTRSLLNGHSCPTTDPVTGETELTELDQGKGWWTGTEGRVVDSDRGERWWTGTEGRGGGQGLRGGEVDRD